MAEERSCEFHNVVPLQIRFNDVDKFGHVNNTIYFQFYDSGKTDYVAIVCKGFDWDRYAIFVVKIEVKSRCLSILVLYDLEQKQSIPFSDEWRKAIIDYDGLTRPTPIVLT